MRLMSKKVHEFVVDIADHRDHAGVVDNVEPVEFVLKIGDEGGGALLRRDEHAYFDMRDERQALLGDAVDAQVTANYSRDHARSKIHQFDHLRLHGMRPSEIQIAFVLHYASGHGGTQTWLIAQTVVNEVLGVRVHGAKGTIHLPLLIRRHFWHHHNCRYARGLELGT